jgi:hypothetical protein
VTRRRSTSTAWRRALAVHAHLARGGYVPPVSLPAHVRAGVQLDAQDDTPICVIPIMSGGSGGLTYARLCPAASGYRRGPVVVVGSPKFVAGAILGATALNMLGPRQDKLRWSSAELLTVVITTRRMWCEVVGGRIRQWVRIGYDGIASMQIVNDALQLYFNDGAEPLRMAGNDALWCAAVIAHYRYGQDAARMLPDLRTTLAS